MKALVLDKYKHVDRLQCGVCKRVLTHELDMKEHMKREHCPHNNVEGIICCGDLDIRCIDCTCTLGDFHERMEKFELHNIKDIKEYLAMRNKLGALTPYWDKMIRRHNKWWKKK